MTTDATPERGLLFRIGRNMASMLLSSAAGEVFNGYATAISALALGASGFGFMAAAQAFSEPFQALSSFGLTMVAMTVVARRNGCDGVLLGTLSGIYAALAAIAVPILLIAALWSGRSAMLPLLCVLSINLAMMPIAGPSNVPIQYDQAMHRLIAVPSLSGMVRIALVYAAIHFRNAPLYHQLAICLSGIFFTGVTWHVSRRAYPHRWQFDRALARELLVLAWPAGVIEVVVVIYSRASYLFLQSAGTRVQGEFAAADRLSRPVLAIAAALVMSSLPSVARLAAANDSRKTFEVYTKVMSRAGLTLAPVVTAAWFIAPPALSRYVPEYAAAAAPLQVLLIGVCFMFMNQLSSMFIVGLGRFRVIMGVAIINLGVYVALASFLVPRYAALGAVYATTIMEGINCLQQVAILTWALRTRKAA